MKEHFRRVMTCSQYEMRMANLESQYRIQYKSMRVENSRRKNVGGIGELNAEMELRNL